MNLLLSGNTMLGRWVNKVIHEEGASYPLEPLAPLTQAADLFFTNLECAISPQNKIYSGRPKAFYFRADPVGLETLSYAGVDLVSLANNHALDANFAGLLDTLTILDKVGIRHVGAGPDLEPASQPVQFEVEGMKIGVLAYCDHQPDFAASASRPSIRYVDLADSATLDLMFQEVVDLAAQVDHVVVAFHWLPNWISHIPPFFLR